MYGSSPVICKLIGHSLAGSPFQPLADYLDLIRSALSLAERRRARVLKFLSHCRELPVVEKKKIRLPCS